MSMIVSNCQQICHSPTNQSKAKMLYSFPKSPRFNSKNPNHSHEFYEIPSTINKRSTSLGKGTKYDFTKNMPKTPAPGAYDSESLFDSCIKKKKGTSFGSGRNQMQSTGFLKKNENPGPGSYEQSSQLNKTSYSLKGKSNIEDKEQKMVPGPGAYDNQTTFNCSGSNINSKYLNRSGNSFSKDKKIKYNASYVPGPGAYDGSKVSLAPDGKYCLSRLENAKTTKFSKAERMGISKRPQTPGPGNYRIPSQFGYYASKTAFQDITNSTLQ